MTSANPSIASSSGITTPATVTPGFPFSAPTPTGEGFFKNLNLSAPTLAGNVFGSGGDTSTNPPSILTSLMRTSSPGGPAGSPSNLFGMASSAVSNNAVSSSSALPSQVSLPSKGTPTENKDTSTPAIMTPSGFPVSTSAVGVFAQALSEGSKSSIVSSTTAAKTLPGAGPIFGAPTTTPAFTPTGVVDRFLGGTKSSTTTSSNTTVASKPLSLSAGSASAFTATSTASPFFLSITPASTNASATAGGLPLTYLSPPTTTTAVTSPVSEGSSTSASSTGGLFSNALSTTNAFGVAPGVVVSSGVGSVGVPSTTASAGNLFAAPTSTAFAPTNVFGSPGNTSVSAPTPFSSSSQGSTFRSTQVFWSSNTTAGAGLGFGALARTEFGSASKPADSGKRRSQHR